MRYTDLLALILLTWIYGCDARDVAGDRRAPLPATQQEAPPSSAAPQAATSGPTAAGSSASAPAAPESAGQQPAEEISADAKADAELGEYVSFPTCGVKVRQPKMFEKADSFDGFGEPRSRSSVVVLSMPAPYAEISAGFTQEALEAKGFTWHGKEVVEIDGMPAILVHFEQPSQIFEFTKYTLAFGDEQRTTLVTASFPTMIHDTFGASLKAAVMSTRIDNTATVDQAADLPFTIDEPSKLKRLPGVNRMLAFNKEGSPDKSPGAPLFIVAPSMGKVTLKPWEDKQEYAERALQQTATIKDSAVTSTEAITIAGFDGFETLAEAKHAQSDTSLIVYQVMLFGEDSYIRMTGIADADLGGEYLPEFKAMARSLKRK